MLKQVDENFGMRCGGVGEKPFTIENKYFVGTIGAYLVFHLALDTCSCYHSVQLNL